MRFLIRTITEPTRQDWVELALISINHLIQRRRFLRMKTDCNNVAYDRSNRTKTRREKERAREKEHGGYMLDGRDSERSEQSVM